MIIVINNKFIRKYRKGLSLALMLASCATRINGMDAEIGNESENCLLINENENCTKKFLDYINKNNGQEILKEVWDNSQYDIKDGDKTIFHTEETDSKIVNISDPVWRIKNINISDTRTQNGTGDVWIHNISLLDGKSMIRKNLYGGDSRFG